MSTHTFTYNGPDSRVSKTLGGNTTTTYLRNGAYVTDGVLSETATSGTTKFTPGISERRGSTTQYLHSGLKNADARTSGQAVDATRVYDAFGNVEGGSGTWSGPFGYAGGFGYQEDNESGLKLLGHRYYDSTTGRFLSKDPIGDGRNWYTYCYNDPVIAADPSGGIPLVIPVILAMMILSHQNTGVDPNDVQTQTQADAQLREWKYDALALVAGLRGGSAVGRAAIRAADRASQWSKAQKLIPKGWAKKPTSKGVGSKWKDPEKKNDSEVRIDKGNPNSSHRSQRVDHVVVRKNGQIIGRDGKPIKGSIKDNAENAHIPLSEYSKWRSWDHP